MHCEFLHWKFHKLRWASTLNPKHFLVPLGPHRPGSRSPPTTGFGLPEDPLTCIGPNRPNWPPTRPPEDHPENSPDDLIHHELKTRRTEQDLMDYDQSRSTGYGKMCNVDLGLQVVTNQESGNRPHPLANIRRTRRPLCTSIQYSSNLHQQLDVGFYSLEARTSINSSCSLCSMYSCVTFEFLALDSSPPNN
jgi:hypothetical protein